MRARIVRMTLSLVASTAIVLALTAAQAGAQGAAIDGRVLDAVSKSPIPLAQIQIVGTTRGTTTGDDGTFRIAGLPFQSEGNIKAAVFDPRVADSLARRATGTPTKGFDGTTDQWVQAKYPARSSAITIADGVEARLIEAEAALKTGDAAGALGNLNTLRGAGLRGGFAAGALATGNA